jgi:hypothetical protein
VLARKNHNRIDELKDVIRDVTDTGAQVVGSVANNF